MPVPGHSSDSLLDTIHFDRDDRDQFNNSGYPELREQCILGFYAPAHAIRIAPISIVTIILSSIRIGGNRLLKSLIGRARDSPDDEEKELLSSTSANVREIWNGSRILRQTGESKTVELVYHRDGRFKIQGRLIGDTSKTPLLPLRRKNAGYKIVGHKFDKLTSADEETSGDVDKIEELLSGKAPNLTLNIDRAVPEPWKVTLFMSFGLLIQAAVMAINAIIVYRWHWLRAGSVVASYGYPVWASGTIGLTLGVSICARVVEFSATKYTLRPKTSKRRFRVIMFQGRISSLGLPAYAIMKDMDNPLVKVSKRNCPPQIDAPNTGRMSLVFFTTAGSFFALGGFICQNIGTRELHWSAGVLQLSATLVLTVIRAWLRRHVGDPPRPAPFQLLNGSEASDLASHLESHTCHILSHFGELYILPRMVLGLSRGDISTRFPTFLNAKAVKRKLTPKDSTETDNCSRVLDRILETQAVLAEHEPDKVEIVNLASGLCNAMREALETVSVGVYPFFERFFHVYMMVSDPSVDEGKDGLRAIIPFYFSNGPESLSTRRTMQAIISLTCYTYALEDMNPYPEDCVILRVLGDSGNDDTEQYRRLLRAWIGKAANIGTWEVSWDGRVVYEDEGQPVPTATCVVFGLPLSLRTKETHRSTYSHPSRIFCEPRRKASLEENIALDLFSSFMLGLVAHQRNELTKFMEKAKGGGCDILADILVKHGICLSREEGRMAIVPALIASRILTELPTEYSTPPPTPISELQYEIEYETAIGL